MYKSLILNKKHEKEYKIFLKKNNKFLWYSSLEYKLLLESYLKVKSIYFIVKLDKKIVGALPLMLKSNSDIGNVINSLPYYGSNGAFLIDSNLKKDSREKIMHLLLKSLSEYTEVNKIASATIITSPMDKFSKNFLENNSDFKIIDYRIGQLTILPKSCDELLSLFENPRPRNIRKAIKSGVIVRKSSKKEDFDFLAINHHKNIEKIGGMPKSNLFFDQVRKNISPKNYSLYVAELDGKRIGALLLFYFNDTVEYFTPCTIFDFRNLQPSSLIIFEAMKDAIIKKYKYWNWGGTWQSQKGVYSFKKKWGAINKKYFYFSKVFNQNIFDVPESTLLETYQHFYTIPFKSK